MENEIWKDIDGYEELYQVSNMGRIRSLDRYVRYSNGNVHYIDGQLIKPVMKRGYCAVNLYKDGIKQHYVHRIVWKTFMGKIPKGMQVNHINENPLDNRLENLNLMSPKDNINWGTGIERRSEKRKRPVTQSLIDGKPFFTYFSLTDATEDLGLNMGKISECCRNKRQTTGGFKWEYATPSPRT